MIKRHSKEAINEYLIKIGMDSINANSQWLFPNSFTHIDEIRVLDVVHLFIQINKYLLSTHFAKHFDCQ